MGHSNLAIKPLGNLVHIRGLKEKEQSNCRYHKTMGSFIALTYCCLFGLRSWL